MARRSLSDEVADALLQRIVVGELPAEALVPGENELSAQHDVSRLTIREAIRTLAAQRILRVERGRGTFVNPLGRWASMDAVLRAVSEGQDDAATSLQLIELRRMMETGACELAAGKLSDEALAGLAEDIEAMQAAHELQDVPGFVAADLRFHERILQASGNVFVAVMFEPLHRILEARRTQTSRVPQIQVHAIAEHRKILAALTSGTPGTARQAMDDHMQQTRDDLQTYILTAGAPPAPAPPSAAD
ncbi:FadR/GntR family transcriptional regulator [Arthrobacter sp. B1805]|uniref:FadR/GntR family transcriptional regulator n=1 Tax=Arthrobacter sp. B1805 TaxID=2058892 RepID=UPI000CE505DC|nr:FadR/GntR family transcriptional regulator [Arthrobacter sp. B1805]